MKTIVLSNPKGGTGKSTIACLLLEYFNYKKQPVQLIDVDPNQTSQWWVNECIKEGRQLSTMQKPLYQLVDTAGLAGSATPYLNRASKIIIPFQPQVFDLKVTSDWIQKIASLHQSWKGKLIFIVNRWQNTKDQRAAVAQLQELVTEQQLGKVLPLYLANKPATYATFLEGRATNFFSQKAALTKDVAALMELLLAEFKI